VLVWKYNWHDNILLDSFSRIFSFATDTDVSLKVMLDCDNLAKLADHFAIPISPQAMEELQLIAAMIVLLNQEEEKRNQSDSWDFFMHNGQYSSKVFYKFMFAELRVSSVYKQLWNSRALHK
jgi:hypothetical protein